MRAQGKHDTVDRAIAAALQLFPGSPPVTQAIATLSIRFAHSTDVDTIVSILIASKEASLPETIEAHDRNVPFWTNRWRNYLARGSFPISLVVDGWVFLAEVEGAPVGYVAYHHTRRFDTDAELQNIYLLKEWQRKGIGAHLLGVVAHRLAADGSQSMCVGYDPDSPYNQFYFKYGAVEMSPGYPWSIWHDVGALATRLPRPPEELMRGLGGQPRWLRPLRFW